MNQFFPSSWEGKMTRGDKLALVGVTIGWLLAGGLMTWAIYAFMVYVLKYW
jgi:ABC-type cobalamin transport system permease subunit